MIFKDEINVINSEAFQKTIRWVIYFERKKSISSFYILFISIVKCSSMVN